MIVFVSNFLNHHQTGICGELFTLSGGEFTFIATEPIPKERTDMGYKDMNKEYPFVLRAYESKTEYKKSLLLCAKADIAIIGSASDDYIKVRDNKKITFKYSERPYKNTGLIKSFLSEARHHYRFLNKNIYLLCASAYTAYDHAKFGMYKGRTYKWGYFPETAFMPYDKLKLIKNKNKKIKILWASRFIKLKHPEDVINLAIRLKKQNISFELEMLGIGELRGEYEKIVNDAGLNDVIIFTGPFSPEEVLKHMRFADIFLFTSDKNEGWGAVLNESMSASCAVVANKEIGSVSYLIKNGENGLMYNRKNKDSLYDCVHRLIHDESFRDKLGKNAYDTINEVWNAKIAAKRLLSLASALGNGKDTPFADGPCSRAGVIKG